MSLRARLALFVAALVVVLLGGLWLHLRLALGGWTTEALDAELEDHAALVASRLEVERDGTLDADDEDDDEREHGRGEHGPSAWAVFDASGRALVDRGLVRLGVTPAPGVGARTFDGPRGRAWRVWSQGVVPEHAERLAPGTSPLVLVVAEPAGRFARVARRIEAGLGLALVLGLAIGVAGAVFAAGLLTRPLRRMSADVARIEARALDQRITVEGSDPDLTRLAAALNGALDRIQRSFDEQRAFVARASHALRTPIASMMSVAEVSLRRERSAAEHRAALTELTELARSASTLVDGLLALSRADAAGHALVRGRVELTALGAELARTFEARAAQAGLRLAVDVPAGLAIDADRAKLRELLDALVDNAIRYTPAGTVELRAVDGGEVVVLEVLDTGAGIRADERARVFERFQRGQAAEALGAAGSGLGLAIVKAIADAHGVAVELAARDGGGTRVSMAWPKAR